jgi:hypothetical protein
MEKKKRKNMRNKLKEVEGLSTMDMGKVGGGGK